MHDSHVHSIFSDDGMEAVEDVVATALSRGCDYVAITDHVNRDYQVIGYDNPQINMSAYVAAMQDFKRRFNKKISHHLLFIFLFFRIRFPFSTVIFKIIMTAIYNSGRY